MLHQVNSAKRLAFGLFLVRVSVAPKLTQQSQCPFVNTSQIRASFFFGCSSSKRRSTGRLRWMQKIQTAGQLLVLQCHAACAFTVHALLKDLPSLVLSARP